MDIVSYSEAASAHERIDTVDSNIVEINSTITTNKESADTSIADLQDKVTVIESIAPTAEEFTATDGQTEIELTYTVGLIDVYVNDEFIPTSDYTADDGAKITFNTALAEGDNVYVKKYVNFAEADGYSKAETDELVTTVDNRVTTEVETINNTLATKLDITGDGSKLTGVSPDIQNYVNAMATTSGGNVAITRTFTAVATDGQTEFFYTEPSKQNDTITITAANDFAYVVTINDVEYSYTSDADATIAEIQDGIIAAVTDDTLGITASGEDLVVESNEVNVSYTLAVGDNLSSVNNTVATDGIKYIPESLTVTVEGIQIDSSDYVAGDGNKIVFNDGLSENSVVTLIAYGGADVYNKSQTNSILTAYATNTVVDNLVESVANLATAQAAIVNDNSTAIDTTQQLIGINESTPSTDANVLEIDSDNDQMIFKINASVNFFANMVFTSNTPSERNVSIKVVDVADDSELESFDMLLSVPNGSTETISHTFLLTVGKNGTPDAPLTVRFEIVADDTGYTMDSFNAVIATSSSYDLASGLTIVNDTSPKLGGDLDLNGFDIPISPSQQIEFDKKSTKAQTIDTDTVYNDNSTDVNYKIYIDNGDIILEEV